MRIPLLIGIFSVLFSSMASGKSLLHIETVRRLHRGHVKRVTVQMHDKGVNFLWQTPRNRTFTYRAVKLSTHLKARIHRYLKRGQTTLALIGKYQTTGPQKGIVIPSMVYGIRRVWTGVRVVKFDGVMPLYTVTVLPRTPQQSPTAFEVRGIVQSKLNQRDNKLVCAFGTWFELQDAPRLMFNQSNGIKGRSLLFYPKQFRHPRSWHQIANREEKMRVYLAAKRRKALKLPPPPRKILYPTLPTSRYLSLYEKCLARLAPWERKFVSATPDPLLAHNPTTQPHTNAPSVRQNPTQQAPLQRKP